MEWNEKKAQEIVNKHKSRFSLRLTFKIVRVVVALMILYAVYMIIVSLTYEFSNIGKRTAFYQQLAIDWTYPELTADFHSIHTSEITPLLTQKIDIPLIRTIGKEDYVVSELHLSKPIFNTFIQREIEKNYPYVANESPFTFYLPTDPVSGKKLNGEDWPNVWKRLEMIHEGHVADLAFSTDDYYSPDQIVELLAPYDMLIKWMPLYMGELKEYEEGSRGYGNNSMALQGPWGLSGVRSANEDYMGFHMVRSLTDVTIEESEEGMLENMQKMLNDKKKLAEVLLRTAHLQERYDYLMNNGFQAYGAVVTGPVKELLKLKELEQINSVRIGQVEYWNWDD